MGIDPDIRPPHRRSLRLPHYDYSRAGAYFVTICTHRRIYLFGDIVKETVRLNDLGVISDTCWRALPQHYPHITLDAFVIMPNHVHGIVVLTDSPAGTSSNRERHPLPEIIRAFKTFSARRINEHRNGTGAPVWQRGYYEHIIRDETSLDAIRHYIANNPLRWNLDPENPKSITGVGAGFKPAPTDRG